MKGAQNVELKKIIMEEVGVKTKVDLFSTMKGMEAGQKVEIPFSMQKESTVRCLVYRYCRKNNCRYSVTADKERLTSIVTRIS